MLIRPGQRPDEQRDQDQQDRGPDASPPGRGPRPSFARGQPAEHGADPRPVQGHVHERQADQRHGDPEMHLAPRMAADPQPGGIARLRRQDEPHQQPGPRQRQRGQPGQTIHDQIQPVAIHETPRARPSPRHRCGALFVNVQSRERIARPTADDHPFRPDVWGRMRKPSDGGRLSASALRLIAFASPVAAMRRSYPASG